MQYASSLFASIFVSTLTLWWLKLADAATTSFCSCPINTLNTGRSGQIGIAYHSAQSIPNISAQHSRILFFLGMMFTCYLMFPNL
jgi:hypothetical protein